MIYVLYLVAGLGFGYALGGADMWFRLKRKQDGQHTKCPHCGKALTINWKKR